MAAEQELPLFLGLTDKTITDIPKTDARSNAI